MESLKRTNEELKTKLQVLEEACLSRLQELELKLCQKEEEKFVNVQARIKELEDEYNQRTDINLNTITEKLNRLEEKIVESEKKSNNSLSLVKSHERTEDSQNEEKLKAAMRSASYIFSLKVFFNNFYQRFMVDEKLVAESANVHT